MRSGGKLGGKLCGYIVDELWEIGLGSMSIGLKGSKLRSDRYVNSVENF